MRDETADLAWAVEHLVQGPSGAPRPELLAAAPEPASVASAPLVYQLASPVPPSWFPLLPVKAADQSVALIGGTVEDGPRAPSGRLLPQLFSPDFQLPDREISRAGVRARFEQRFSARRMAENYLSVYEEMVERPRTAQLRVIAG